jgi:hypothetical protein
MNRMIRTSAVFAGLWLASFGAIAQTADLTLFEKLMDRTFVTVPEASQTGNADWKHYADLVSVELEQRRLKRVATLGAAEFAVLIQYTDGPRPSMQIVLAEAKPYRDEKKVVMITRVSVSTGSGFKGTPADLVPQLVESIFVHP